MATKSNMYIEYQGQKADSKELIAKAKKIWTSEGNKVKDLLTMDLYIKPEENMVYYVFNEDITGSFSL